MNHLKLSKLKRDYEWALNKCFFQIIRNCSVSKSRIDAYKVMNWINVEDGSHSFEISNMSSTVYPDQEVINKLNGFGLNNQEVHEFVQYMFKQYMGLNRIMNELRGYELKDY